MSTEHDSQESVDPLSPSNSLDDKYIYVFVRQDMALADQLTDVGHAAFSLGMHLSEVGVPSIVVIGVPHPKALAKVIEKLKANSLSFLEWIDPDFTNGTTAVAVGPLDSSKKILLANYRLWKHSPGTEQSVCRVTVDGRANAAVAQEKERPIFNGEVDSSILSCGSNLRCQAL